ncbi:MAG TPA: hypothetical protein DHW14_05615 [Clostridiales bacterium]|nr:hypothetical protein [Clostridiales bacterium]
MKPIEAVVEKGPNYAFHLMAVAGVGFESDYGERYRHTVTAEDRALLAELRDPLTFGDGRAGPLVLPVIFLPSYLNLDTVPAIREYFERLDRALAGDPQAFLGRYRAPLRRLCEDWVETVDERWLAAGAGFRGPIARLGRLFVRNFPTYEAEVWPAERPGMEEVASRLDRHFAGRDVIGAWERFTGLEFRAARYQIVLVSATKNGPDANSLGYDRNVFYPYQDFDTLTQLMSHETGTHLLIDLIKAFTWPDADGRVRLRGKGRPLYDFDLVYRGFENLCRFYNSLVLGAPVLYDMGRDYRTEEFDAVYRRLHASQPDMKPLEMLLAAVEELGGAGPS